MDLDILSNFEYTLTTFISDESVSSYTGIQIKEMIEICVKNNDSESFKSLLIHIDKKISLEQQKKYNIHFYFKDIKSSTFFSLLIYSKFGQTLPKDDLFDMAIHIRNGTSLYSELYSFPETLTSRQTFFILKNGSVKDIKHLIPLLRLSEPCDDGESSNISEEILKGLLYNTPTILEWYIRGIRYLKKASHDAGVPKEIYKIIWENTIYSKIFSTENLKKVITPKKLNQITKKLLILFNNDLINESFISECGFSKKILKNLKIKDVSVFCKYNNFCDAASAKPAIPNIKHELLKSLYYNKYFITPNVIIYGSKLLKNMFPPIKEEFNKKMEYSIVQVKGISVYLITDYYVEGNLKERLDKLSIFHPWAIPEATIQEEMKALEEYVENNKEKEELNLWWPRRFYYTDFFNLPLAPGQGYTTIYFPDYIGGWLYIDNMGLEFSYNSKFEYLFKNTNWDVYIDNVEDIKNNKYFISNKCDYPDGLWKCRFEKNVEPWTPGEEFHKTFYPIELLPNSVAKPKKFFELDIDEIKKFFNDIIIPKTKYNKIIIPFENSVIKSIKEERMLYSHLGRVNFDCGFNKVKDTVNIDSNPFYSAHNNFSLLSRNYISIYKYSSSLLENNRKKLEELNTKKNKFIYLVFFDSDLFENEFEYKDESPTPQRSSAHQRSWIKKTGYADNHLNFLELSSIFRKPNIIYTVTGYISWLHDRQVNFLITNKDTYYNILTNYTPFLEYRAGIISGLVLKRKLF